MLPRNVLASGYRAGNQGYIILHQASQVHCQCFTLIMFQNLTLPKIWLLLSFGEWNKAQDDRRCLCVLFLQEGQQQCRALWDKSRIWAGVFCTLFVCVCIYWTKGACVGDKHVTFGFCWPWANWWEPVLRKYKLNFHYTARISNFQLDTQAYKWDITDMLFCEL